MYMSRVKIFISLCIAVVFVGCTEKTTGYSSHRPSPIVANEKVAIVQTDKGKVAGYIDGGVYIYKGVPYAKAERFMPPVEVEPWEGVRSSRAYGPVCPQAFRAEWLNDESGFCQHWNDGFASEDCQRLNIWTRSINDEKRRPVMVWLHGGAFSSGSGQEMDCYDGSSLASTDEVVVVTLNHRLNVLGFLDLSAFGDKYKYSGNVGMLDIVAALQWVKKNISHFGGDPNNVTIFGQSGGGGKVSTLMSMPSAKGLFHKAITQSGAHIDNMKAKYTRKIGIATLEQLGISASNIDKVNDVPYDELLEAGNRAIAKVKEEASAAGDADIFLFGWSPTVDGDLLPKDPFRGAANECSKDVPLMTGSCLHEFAFSSFMPNKQRSTMDEIRPMLEKFFGKNTEQYIETFAKAYPDYRPCDLLDVEPEFRANSVLQARTQAALHGAPVYNFLFCWESPILDGRHRASHCMDIPFVFHNIHLAREITGGVDSAYELSDIMSRSWIAFAKTGNPNVEGLPEWEPFTEERKGVMIFDNECRMSYGHDAEWLKVVTALHYSKYHLMENQSDNLFIN